MNKCFSSHDAEWLNLLAIRPEQRKAIAAPSRPIGALLSRKALSASARARLINDFLASPAAD